MVFPQFEINEIQKQEARDLARFDLDFDIPDHFLPEFPAPIYLTTRPDLGDVSQGKLVTIDNYYEIFSGILNPKQLEGLRLLLTPSRSSNSTRRRIAARTGRAAASPALIATRMGTPMRQPTLRAMFVRRNTAIALRPRRCVA